ncbi:CHAT domain-containing protein [Chitinophaga filiformis]|uniref:CHAT domain-containing protein n=1 Tax=Chitinophaga filiformis TaxID=104663 RepID=A0ABY4HZP1_CHIFI|nr:CHAT domain-containing protein [Chitinophaga filiformis]UPK67961.1 CHAT domain-containing protein [Chitinophaga filiformis]
MHSGAPKLTIDIEGKDWLTVKIKAGRMELPAIEVDFSDQRIGEYYNILYDALDKFLEIIGDEKQISISDANRALKYLNSAGAGLMFYLFGNRISEVRDFMRRAVETWRMSSTDAYTVPFVEVRSLQNKYIPVEFLPVFDSAAPAAATNSNDLLLIASRFLGFSTCINRIYHRPSLRSQVKTDAKIAQDAKMRVRFFKNRKLTRLQEEEDFLRNHAGIELLSKWPVGIAAPDQFINELAALIWNGKDIATGVAEPQDDIHHFTCHCINDYALSSNSKLHLTYPHKGLIWTSNKDVYVSIDSLAKEFGQQKSRDTKTSYPLVFLNACKSNKRNPLGLMSFPDLFVKHGNKGVIGTETMIPEMFAGEFSRCFYDKLVNGFSISQALHTSRWYLLKRFNNPLGILYTLYADPDLRMENHSHA